MKYRFAVIGLGRFGTTVAKELAEKGAEVLAIDNNESIVEDMRDDVAYAVALDATDFKALKAQNIEEMDAVIVSIGSDFESLLLVTVHLLDMKIKRVISRANTLTQRAILEKMGIQEIISPEFEVGITLAQKLLTPGIISFMQLPGDYEIVEISAPPNVHNRTLADIDLRKKYNINLITVKREEHKNKKDGSSETGQHVVGVPQPDTRLLNTDTLIVMGRDKDIKRFIEINK